MNKLQRWWNAVGSVDKELLKFASVFIVFILVCTFMLFVGVAFTISQPYCNAATAQIGFPHRWGFWKGCQIEVTEGQWIPLESYRYIVPGN
jgi:hypothetical protein